MGTPRVLLGSSFLAQWINIAIRDEAAARAARDRVLAAADSQRRLEAMQDEMQASMVAVSASAHAIDALYGTTRELIELPPGTEERWKKNNTRRWSRILETFKRACNLGGYATSWAREFRWLFDLRDAAVHHDSPLNDPVPHPAGIPDLGNVAKEMADYELGAATRATDLAVQVAVVMHEQPRREQKRFADWAADHAPWAARLKQRRPMT